MPQSRAEQKLRELGLAPALGLQAKARAAGPASPRGAAGKRHTFKLYFPRPPYNGTLYHAAFSNGLFNFVGLVLGHHGTTIQRIQKDSGARVEIHDKDGNLNGDYPSAADPSLHAFISAESKESLEKAVDLLLDVLAPMNTDFEPIKVIAGGGALLEASALPRPATVSIKHISAPQSPPPETKSTSPVAAPASAPGDAANGLSNVWSGRQVNPLLSPLAPANGNQHEAKANVGLNAAKQDYKGISTTNIDTQDLSIDSKRGSYDMDGSSTHATSFGMDSLHSMASTLSEDCVNTPTSRSDPLSNGSSLLSFGSGLSCATATTNNNNNNNNGTINNNPLLGNPLTVTDTNNQGLPEFPSWHPFASTGLFESLHKSITPQPEEKAGGVSKATAAPVAFPDTLLSAPFPGIGSWKTSANGADGQNAGYNAQSGRPTAAVNVTNNGLQGLYGVQWS